LIIHHVEVNLDVGIDELKAGHWRFRKAYAFRMIISRAAMMSRNWKAQYGEPKESKDKGRQSKFH
jgi:hypothetical protein